jgi:2-hydroxy-3-keto-5-methylthiopentenyl-1-phosphate phosphatase
MMKTLIQCDFDGTITRRDASFLILDLFGNKNWGRWFQDYREGKISVGRFNTMAFATVKADEPTLVKLIRDKIEVRPGFRELLEYCDRRDFKFVIVSNGLDFYIRAILGDIGVSGIEVFAAKSSFDGDGIDVRYLGPNGELVEDCFKDTYLHFFQQQGYRVIYAGNGASDFAPASEAYHTFAVDDLLAQCEEAKVNCTPFRDFNDIVRGLESLSLT